VIHGVTDRRDASEEDVLFLFSLEALIEASRHSLETSLKCVPGAKGDFVAHKHSNLIHLLPFVFEPQ